MDTEPLAPPVTKQIKPFDFTGNAREYFSIWIVNVLLTILTLGIYSAWAKVRTNQYFYGNTQLAGSSFRYLADPKQILKGRIVAVVFFAAYYFSGLISPMATGITILVIATLVPAMVVMSMSFQLRNTSYRNIRFNFTKDFKRAYKIFAYPLLFVVPYFILIAYMQNSLQTGELSGDNKAEPPPFMFLIGILPLLIMLLFPLWQHMIIKFKAAHAHFGQAGFSFTGTAGNLYGIYFKAGLGMFLFGAIVAVVFGGLGAVLNSGDEASTAKAFIPIIGIILIMPMYLWIFAYIHAKKTNFIFGNLGIDKHEVQSDLKVGKLLSLYITNTLAMIVSLGLLMPWAKIRTARYRAEMTSLIVAGDLDGFIGVQTEGQSAFGEEMGEIFDMDLGF